MWSVSDLVKVDALVIWTNECGSVSLRLYWASLGKVCRVQGVYVEKMSYVIIKWKTFQTTYIFSLNCTFRVPLNCLNWIVIPLALHYINFCNIIMVISHQQKTWGLNYTNLYYCWVPGLRNVGGRSGLYTLAADGTVVRYLFWTVLT